jgi:NADH-quinone oxidoreductase subunit F
VRDVLVAEVLNRRRDRAGGTVPERAERATEDVVALVEEQLEVGLGAEHHRQRRRLVRLDGHREVQGLRHLSLSGHVANPGQYEAPLGITLRTLIDLAGGVRPGHELKFWTPGGSSTPILTAEHLDVPLDFEGVGGAGSMLGTRALQIFDETTCVVRAVLRWTEFYAHESCGKCTPCREGTYWLKQVLKRLEKGQGSEEDLATITDIADNILGRSFCALGDGATSPIHSSVKHFRDEYLKHFEIGGCPFDPAASTVWGNQ